METSPYPHPKESSPQQQHEMSLKLPAKQYVGLDLEPRVVVILVVTVLVVGMSAILLSCENILRTMQVITTFLSPPPEPLW